MPGVMVVLALENSMVLLWVIDLLYFFEMFEIFIRYMGLLMDVLDLVLGIGWLVYLDIEF